MSEPEAVVSSRRRIPAVWVVPIVAMVLGLWMVVYTAMTEGPEIQITFSTAEGIEEGKTKLLTRNVQLGLVQKVTLNDDLESVTVIAKLDREATPLLRDDTRFWVVRPRFGARGISGVGTLLSGGYIEVEPGRGDPSDRRSFEGLDDLPVTPVGTPGLSLVLVSNKAGSTGTGDPVLYHGFEVGRIEEAIFQPEKRSVRYKVFIDAPYDGLVNQASRFWDAGGIDFNASAEGVQIRVGTLQTLLSGGVAFDVPEGRLPGGPVEHGDEFALYDGYEAASAETYRHSAEFVVSFAQSIRGLVAGAPVEYRGIQVGVVRRIMVRELMERSQKTSGLSIPIVISLNPGRLRFEDDEASIPLIRAELKRNVASGLRATLETGNLITGSLFIAFDYFPDDEPAEIGEFAGYQTLPTLPAGLEGIGRQISQLLAKLNKLPLDTTVRELNRTLRELRTMVGSEQFAELPASLNATLDELTAVLGSLGPESQIQGRLEQTLLELDRTLRQVQGLASTLERQPNGILFDKAVTPDPEPRGER